MKPTRNIVKPTPGLWGAKRRVWYQKNDDRSQVLDEMMAKGYKPKLDEEEWSYKLDMFVKKKK